MVLVCSVDSLGLHDFMVGLLLDIVAQLLLVYHPPIVLTVVAVYLLLFDII